MHSKILLLLLVAAINIKSALLTDWDKYFGLEKKPCEATGLRCSEDCKQIERCFQIGDEPQLIHNCTKEEDGHLYCRKDNNGVSCSADIPQCGGSDEILCTAHAEFPHPALPTATVRCVANSLQPSEICYCLDKFVSIKSIDLPCDSDSPTYEPVKCDHAGQNGPIVGSYCYMCADDGIYVYVCSKNSNKDLLLNSSFANNKNCIPWSSSPTEPSIECHYEGELFPAFGHCHSYYRCDADLVPQFKTCPKGEYFDAHFITCRRGDCVD